MRVNTVLVSMLLDASLLVPATVQTLSKQSNTTQNPQINVPCDCPCKRQYQCGDISQPCVEAARLSVLRGGS